MTATGNDSPGAFPQGEDGSRLGSARGPETAPGADAADAADAVPDYLREPDADASGGGSAQDPPGPEDPRRREARLRRRRRLLKIGAVPAALATIVSLWLGSIFLISLAGNRAVAAGHYDTALSRYRLVARINPWVEQWRVYFNLGTGQLAADDPTSAITSLNQALAKAPTAKVDSQTGAKQTDSPECMVRTNLYIAHVTLVSKAQEGGDSAVVTEHTEAAKEAADACEMPPPPEDSPSQSPDPSAGSSSTPGPTPSPDPSATPSPDPSSDPSATPSPEASSSASSSPGESASSSPSTQPTPTPVDDRAQRLRNRNNGSAGTTSKPKDGGGGGGKPW